MTKMFFHYVKYFVMDVHIKGQQKSPLGYGLVGR